MPFVKSEPFKESDIPCAHFEHNPPTLIYQKPGNYTWECPICGEQQSYTVPPAFAL